MEWMALDLKDFSKEMKKAESAHRKRVVSEKKPSTHSRSNTHRSDPGYHFTQVYDDGGGSSYSSCDSGGGGSYCD